MSKKRALVSASDIGKAAYCPHSLSLSKRSTRESDESVRAKDRGVELHEDLTSKVLGSDDRRCYVATYAFGADHPVTSDLRAWRDRVLMPTCAGRGLVGVYYALSPWLVGACKRWPALGRLIKRGVQRFSRMTGGRQ